MFKKILKITGITIGVLFALVYTAYFLSTLFFMERFIPNTFINDINVFGMTPKEASAALEENAPDYSLEVIDYDGSSYVIDGDDVGFRADYLPAVSALMDDHNPFVWPMGYYCSQSAKVSPKYRIDLDSAGALLDKLHIFEAHDDKKGDVYITRELGKYFLIDATRPVLDADKARASIIRAMTEGDASVDISDCYVKAEYSDLQQQTIDLYEAIDKYQSTDITYVDADLRRHLDFTEINNWLRLDSSGLPYLENGRLAVNEDKAARYVESLKDTFETKDDCVTWTRKDGSKAELPYKGKGYKIDADKETERLLYNIYSGNTYERKPIYSQEALGRGNDIVGESYVEVDFEHQKLYCYVDGALKLTSDVVTGNMARHCNTPAMISTIYYMQKNRTLHGDNYDSFVYYWMAFYNHYGLHDATWRKEFGGDIYLNAGSHGCVNLPKDAAAKLYDMVHVGTPVVLYYGQEKEGGE